jgi:hypothetical protein
MNPEMNAAYMYIKISGYNIARSVSIEALRIPSTSNHPPVHTYEQAAFTF